MHRRLGDYLEALGSAVIEFSGDPQLVIRAATSDSRQIGDGGLFIAIAGSRLDGGEFIPAAIAAGAVAVIAEVDCEIPAEIAFIRVDNAYAAAGIVAEVDFDFPIRFLRSLAVTGTNGKTTCAFLLQEILRLHGLRTGLIGTIHYDTGRVVIPAERTTPTPFELQELLARMRADRTDWVIMEVSSHALAQRRLGRTRFKGGLFTNLSGDHGDYHLTMENYYQAKARLFTEYLEVGAPALINLDDDWGRRLFGDLSTLSSRRPISFGLAPEADYRVVDLELALDGSRFRLERRPDWSVELRTGLLGSFNVSNLAGVAALAAELQFPASVIAQAVAAFTGAPGRLEMVKGDYGFRVVVDYAHTDDALKNVLATLRALKPGKLSVVFGCGGDRDRTKRPRMGKVAAEMADRIYLTSDNPRSEKPADIIDEIRQGIPAATACRVVEDRGRAIRQAVREAGKGDIVLIAGKGHEKYQVTGRRQIFFDDCIEASRALRELTEKKRLE